MRLTNVLFVAALGGFALFASCKKVDDLKNAYTGSGDLAAGQATISFNTDKDFNGTTSINIKPGSTTSAVKSSSNSVNDNIVLTATSVDISTGKISTAQLAMYVPKNSTTTSGNITVPFKGSSTNFAVLTISNTNTGQSTPAYGMETGNVVITKLTATEIEGTFSGHATNDTENTSINLSNGHFAGKFN
ncbi:MAG: hypothetical protein JST52_02155 [Bacteroidetes bacterium]|nr:hypothetical protein [Bacteroidota bacterium]MBS1739603.1 hypothetical protein [Bacteroidota bacterium]MBS1777497.1 hypothetical protein [Bacteroidota bacterium]